MRERKYPAHLTPVERVKALRKARMEAGLCQLCGAPREVLTRIRCNACAADHIRKGKEVRAEKPETRWAMWARARRARIRAVVIEKYGGRCECCGEADPAFLTIDHKNNDGRQERAIKNLSSGGAFYASLVKGPPRDDLRILCWNCNCARHYHGVCPHEIARSA